MKFQRHSLTQHLAFALLPLEGSKTGALLKEVQALASHFMGCTEDYTKWLKTDVSFKRGGRVCWVVPNAARAAPLGQGD